VAELGPDNVRALIAHRWRDNVDGVRRVLAKVHARIATGSIMAAADALGLRHQSLRETFESLGLVFDRNERRRSS
jgi:hypothetical protein